VIIGVPAALWGLAAVVALILMSLWRLRPERVTVPSVALWKRLPSRVPPVRALRRPRWSASLLLQALAVGAMVSALAQFLILGERPQGRRLAVVVDLGARARMDLVRAELEAIRAATAGDDVVLFEVPALRRGAFRTDVEKVDYARPPEAAISLARAEGRRVIWVGDRPAGADVDVLVGAPSANVGVVDLAVEEGRVFARLLNLGSERELAVRVGSREHRVRAPPGESSHVFALEGEARVALPADDFPLDDVAEAERLGPVAVELRGIPHALLRRAIEAQEGARIVDRGGALIVANGVDAEPGEGTAVVIGPAGEAFAPGAFALARHRLAEGTKASEWEGLRDVAALPEGYEPVVYSGGRAVVGVKGRTVRISGTLGELPDWPSFSIFFANVLESVRSSRGSWVVRRTGPSHPRAGSGAWVVDAEASRLGAERRPFRAGSLGPAPRGESRADLSAWLGLAALALAAAAWRSERRA
jgi:hypothetical protein